MWGRWGLPSRPTWREGSHHSMRTAHASVETRRAKSRLLMAAPRTTAPQLRQRLAVRARGCTGTGDVVRNLVERGA